jgi:hypothetical protein
MSIALARKAREAHEEEMKLLSGVTDEVLRLIATKELQPQQSLRILEMAGNVINTAMRNTQWGEPLVPGNHTR